MTTDYRALCAELVKDFDDLRESSEGVTGFHRNGDLAPWDELSESGRYPWLSSFDRARALLAEPEAEGPTDEELAALMPTRFLVNQSASARAIANIGTDEQVAQVRAILDGEAIAYARAVLARWGRPTPQPVAVAPLDKLDRLIAFDRDNPTLEATNG